jgi:hypothetical protein
MYHAVYCGENNVDAFLGRNIRRAVHDTENSPQEKRCVVHGNDLVGILTYQLSAE